MRRAATAAGRAAKVAALSMLLLGGGARAQEDANDPLEPLNRTIFGLNQLVDLMVLEPVSIVYGHLPSPARAGVRNFLDNLKSPVVFANDLLQGEGDRAGVTLARFMINTLVGVFGLFDLATEFGYAKHGEDFGQTLGKWGVGEGPYIMLPLLGPSSARDTAGLAVDSFGLDPVTYLAPLDARIGRAATDGVDRRYELTPVIDDLRANSIDLYATFRTVYRQRRAAEINNGAAPADNQEYEDIFDEPDLPAAPKP